MSPGLWNSLADLVMVVHFGFVVFVVAGGLLVLWRRRVAWIHLPCVLYGAAIELFGWGCPLTPLEQSLRRTAGSVGYRGGFIEHYVGRILYPGNWGEIHVFLGIGVLVLNGAIYGWLLYRRRDRSGGAVPSGPGEPRRD